MKSKYNQFKQLVITLVNNFKQEFENTEFDDFPEFMETNVILDLNEGYNDDSDYKSDDEGTYQGDMAFEEYVKFKRNYVKKVELLVVIMTRKMKIGKILTMMITMMKTMVIVMMEIVTDILKRFIKNLRK